MGGGVPQEDSILPSLSLSLSLTCAGAVRRCQSLPQLQQLLGGKLPFSPLLCDLKAAEGGGSGN